jgi:hypothetical protein
MIILFAGLFIGCPTDLGEDVFHFYNNSEYDVIIYLSIVPSEMGASLYPDTTLPSANCRILCKHGTYFPYTYTTFYNKSDTFCLFIFHPDTIEKYDWEIIRREYKILKRYDLAISDINNVLNRNIYYPPTKSMKNIKMWPPYGSKLD